MKFLRDAIRNGVWNGVYYSIQTSVTQRLTIMERAGMFEEVVRIVNTRDLTGRSDGHIPFQLQEDIND